jgi:hypothetical protein
MAAISVQFIIICHTACLSELKLSLTWFICDICRVERSFLRLPNDKIMINIEWKQQHAFGMMIQMLNDKKPQTY